MSPETLWPLLLLRIGLPAACVITASILAERSGPFFGGLIVALPVSAGPAYVLLALQSDDAFIAQSAIGSLIANAATGLFLLTSIQLAPRQSLPRCLAAALGVWLLATLGLRTLPWTALGATFLNLLVYAVLIGLTRGGVGVTTEPRARQRWFDLPLRALLVGTLVASVVTASQAIGPSATGIAALFPVVFTSLTAIMHPRIGGRSTAALLASAARAMPGFGFGLLALHLLAEPIGRWRALLAFAAVCVLWSGMLTARRRLARLTS
jgi:FtsH-binding integral membrane protein